MAETSDNCPTSGLSKSGRAEPQPSASKIPAPFHEGRKSVSFEQGTKPNPPGGVNFQS